MDIDLEPVAAANRRLTRPTGQSWPQSCVQGEKAEGQMEERRTQQRRTHERRRNDARFFLVERRKGNLWKYGSITLCVALLANLGWRFLR